MGTKRKIKQNTHSIFRIIFILLTIVAFIITSCNTLKETNKQLKNNNSNEINNNEILFTIYDMEVDKKNIIEKENVEVVGEFNNSLDKIKVEFEVENLGEYNLFTNLIVTNGLTSSFDVYVNGEYSTFTSFTSNNTNSFNYYEASSSIILQEGYNKIILINFTDNIILKDFKVVKIVEEKDYMTKLITPNIPENTINLYNYLKEKYGKDIYGGEVDYLEMTSLEMMKHMKKGWNLGNTLDSIVGKNNQGLETEIAWGNLYTTKEMIDTIKNVGFDILRIPTSWGEHMNEDYVVDIAYMDRVQEVVDYGIDNDMFVILNTHHEEWIYPDEEHFENNAKQLKALWTQICERFKDYDGKLIFEVLNEPRLRETPIEWTGGDAESRAIVGKLSEVAYTTIRNSGGNNNKRHIMIPTYAASSNDNVLEDFSIPKKTDDHIFVSIHNYDPYDFALNTIGDNVWGYDEQKEIINSFYERLDKYLISKDIAVIIGESGAMNKNNIADRIEWAKYFYGIAEKNGVPIIWWDNGLIEGGENFGLLNRETLEFTYPELVDAILNKE